MRDPVVSIVVNNYNYDRFVGQAIQSALDQTYRNVEVIVVDDGSTDGSRAVIDSFGRAVIPLYKANGGQGSAYNEGYAMTEGDIVCFLDADDTLLPHAVESAVPAFGDDRVVKVQWPLLSSDVDGRSDGTVVTVEPPPDGDLLGRVLREGPLYDLNYATGAAYRRDYLSQVLPVPEESYRNGADVYILTLAPAYGALRTMADPLATYRVHSSNNYRNRPLDDDRLRDYVRRFDTNADVLAEHLRLRGLQPDPAAWRSTAYNSVWPRRLLEVREAIRRHVPPSAIVAIIDGAEWGDIDAVDDRRVVRVCDRDGVYWGDPSDDEAAITAVQGRLAEGARHVVLWWTCSWWRDVYPGFLAWLDANGRRVFESPGGVIYQLDDQEGTA